MGRWSETIIVPMNSIHSISRTSYQNFGGSPWISGHTQLPGQIWMQSASSLAVYLVSSGAPFCFALNSVSLHEMALWFAVSNVCPMDRRPLIPENIRQPDRVFSRMLRNLAPECDSCVVNTATELPEPEARILCSM